MHYGNLKALKASERGLALTLANRFLTLLTQTDFRHQTPDTSDILTPSNLYIGMVPVNNFFLVASDGLYCSHTWFPYYILQSWIIIFCIMDTESWYCQWPTKHLVQSFSNGPSWRREPISSVKGYNFILGMKQRYQTTQYHSEKKFSINGMIQTPRASSWSGRSTNGSSSFDMLNHITIY